MLRVGIDIGGTFTDFLYYDEDTGQVEVVKVMTTARPEKAIAEELSKRLGKKFSAIIHATTICTNALLTRSGLALTAMVTNNDFRDVIEIGRQRRPKLYDVFVKRPEPLIKRKDRFTLRCRILSSGKELVKINQKELRGLVRKIVRGRYSSVAVCFLNSYVNPKHEKEVRNALKDGGFTRHVSLSSEVAREYREYERFSTTVVNAVVSPIMGSYIDSLKEYLRERRIRSKILFMNSDGGITTEERIRNRAVLSIESGPAAGVLASAYLAKKLKMSKCITFDMGGTTAKASVVENYEPEYTFEYEVGGEAHLGRIVKGSGYALKLPFINISEVSAGGGSIAWVDEAGQLNVGPRSAGSEPGPACYGKGEKEPTVTDANVLLGRLSQEHLLDGKMKVHYELARSAISNLSGKLGVSPETTASSILKIANSITARAISLVTSERGKNPEEFTMIAFGGAGPLHCCDVAEELGIKQVFIPNHPGLFSAFGLLSSDITAMFVHPVMRKSFELEPEFNNLERDARKEMHNVTEGKLTIKRFVDARYEGQAYEITIPYQKGMTRLSFDRAHRKRYGFSSKDEVEVVNIRIKVSASVKKAGLPAYGYTDKPRERREAFISNKYRQVKVVRRESLTLSEELEGPLIIEEYDSTTVVNKGWRLKNSIYGMMIRNEV